jgi:hypothetical protein
MIKKYKAGCSDEKASFYKIIINIFNSRSGIFDMLHLHISK